MSERQKNPSGQERQSTGTEIANILLQSNVTGHIQYRDSYMRIEERTVFSTFTVLHRMQDNVTVIMALYTQPSDALLIPGYQPDNQDTLYLIVIDPSQTGECASLFLPVWSALQHKPYGPHANSLSVALQGVTEPIKAVEPIPHPPRVENPFLTALGFGGMRREVGEASKLSRNVSVEYIVDAVVDMSYTERHQNLSSQEIIDTLSTTTPVGISNRLTSSDADSIKNRFIVDLSAMHNITDYLREYHQGIVVSGASEKTQPYVLRKQLQELNRQLPPDQEEGETEAEDIAQLRTRRDQLETELSVREGLRRADPTITEALTTDLAIFAQVIDEMSSKK